MTRSLPSRIAGPLLGIVASLLAAAAPAAQSVNWARAHVEAREAAHLKRLLGDRRSAAPPLTPRVIGGMVAPSGPWPVVSLELRSVPNSYRAHFCGGTLIGTRFVLTAAHCVDFFSAPARQLQVLTGTGSLAEGGTRRDIRHVSVHPKWDSSTFDYDVAVLELKSDVDGVFLPSLITPNQAKELAVPGTPALVAGWGDITDSEFSEKYPRRMRYAFVPIQPRRDCADRDSYGKGAITARMLCAGFDNGRIDTCQGDSGGPLVVADRDGYYRLLAGIVSSGTGCADPELFGIYTRVTAVRSWILEQLH